MKIISYNVNGIRAAIQKGFFTWLQSANPDVLCLQEIKATSDQLDLSKFQELGYKSYWFSAEKKGYSGVAVLSKKEPLGIKYGIDLPGADAEGRNLRIDFEDYSVMSMYLPSGTNPDRLDFKFKYMEDFLKYATDLRKTIPNLLICGDYNICHKPIDIHDPVRNVTVSGFLPEEREWLDRFLESGFIDTFRVFNDQPHQYSWWSYRANARNNNKGWRIDYVMATPPLKEKLKTARILPEANHSDHCPILLELN